MQKLILDVDTGIDDALAILYALGDESSDLIGLTTTYGNIDIKQATQNSLDILDLAGATDIPVYQGASHNLSSEKYIRREVTDRIHGINGIGDVSIHSSSRTIENQYAADFMIDSALEYGQDLKLVCVGPLTNLALAYEKNPDALENLKEIVFMGGALTVPGNTTRFAEANIFEDAVAAKTILESQLPLKMVGLDVTMRTLLTQEATDKWRQLGTERGQAIAEMTEFYFKSYQERLGTSGCALHDPLAVAIALYPGLVDTLALNLTVGLEVPERGLTIGDYEKLNYEKPTTEVCIQVDKERFLSLFMSAMKKVLG